MAKRGEWKAKLAVGAVLTLLLPDPAAAQAARNCQAGLRQFEVVAKAVPNAALTDESTKTVYLKWLRIANTTGGALTFTVQDRQGTPKELFKTVSLAANSTVLITYNESSEKMTSGISWQASGTGLVGAMYGCQVP